jgi:hypothetical protein
MPSSPPRLARAPDFRRVTGDAARHKALAHRAYRSARAVELLPAAWLDQLWVRTLQSAEIAPEPVKLRRYRRCETLFRLLNDLHGWPRSDGGGNPLSRSRPRARARHKGLIC